MPRNMVQRTFSEVLTIPVNSDGAKTCLNVVDGNAGVGVTWLHWYVSTYKSVTCEVNGLPVDQITEVSVLDPYFYH